MLVRVLAALVVLVSLCTAYTGVDLPVGPYCGTNNKCCDGRRDECSHRILGTLCYCDTFCQRNGTDKHDDCCPDYEPVCLGLLIPEPLKTCQHDYVNYLPGTKRKQNCNECSCYDDGQRMVWECSEDICLVDGELIDDINGNSYGWTAINYTQFWGHKLSEGIKFRLGTFPISERTRNMNPIKFTLDGISLPDSFDARNKWPRYISDIVDQGWCGSDWAISTSAVASDRFGIMSSGAENIRLSPQMLLSCSNKGQRGCAGGHVDRAWNFIIKFGLVPEDCLPYVGQAGGRCTVPLAGNLVDAHCPTKSKTNRVERYTVGPASKFAGEEDIMYEIETSGPVQAVMKVYQDFFQYRDGIYRHSNKGDRSLVGYHSVRIVGWGEENQQKYWLVANSWGEQWGENGYFRIARGENESEIESFVLSTVANVYQSQKK